MRYWKTTVSDLLHAIVGHYQILGFISVFHNKLNIKNTITKNRSSAAASLVTPAPDQVISLLRHIATPAPKFGSYHQAKA
jgi:hypothetical protein